MEKFLTGDKKRSEEKNKELDNQTADLIKIFTSFKRRNNKKRLVWALSQHQAMMLKEIFSIGLITRLQDCKDCDTCDKCRNHATDLDYFYKLIYGDEQFRKEMEEMKEQRSDEDAKTESEKELNTDIDENKNEDNQEDI